MVTTQRAYELLRRLAWDESGDVIAEYALVMTVLTISMLVWFDYIAKTGTTSVGTNETNMSQMASRAQ